MTTENWTERQIAAGRLAPAARDAVAEDAAHQFNEANALTRTDADWLYTPGQAQVQARDVLRFIDHVVPVEATITLTDSDDHSHRNGAWFVSPGHVDAACEEFRLATGIDVNADALVRELPWA